MRYSGCDYNCALNTLLDRKRASMTTGHVDEGSREHDLMSLKDLEDVWRRRHPNNKEYTFERGESKSRIDFYLVSNETHPKKDQTSIIPFLHTDHNAITFILNTDNVEKRLELLLKSNNQNTAEIDQIKQTLEKAYEEQANAYQIRAKEKGMSENERSTKYVFNLEKRRAKQKVSTIIKSENSSVKYGICNILK